MRPVRSWSLAACVVAALACVAQSAAAQDAKPKRRDSPAALRPPEVKYEATVEPAHARPGDTVTYTVTVTVDAPWHIYAWAEKQPAEGPRATQFDVFDPGGLQPVPDAKTGEVVWAPDRPPVRKKEPAFPDLAAVEFYEKQVSWSIPLKVPANAKPGKVTLRSQIYFQICDDNACKPPSYVTVPDAELTIEPAGGGGMGAVLPSRSALIVPLVLGVIETPSTGAASTTAPSTTTTPARPVRPAGEIGEAIEKGLIPFILVAALHGLGAMLMPCIWPLVPITVNFFVKQSQAKGGRPVALAVTYCLAIIGIYTAIGLIAAIFFGAASTTKLGNNPWVNLVFGLAFIAFGLSLLGLFEIRLPSGLMNASAKGEARGGLIGVIFMAVTLTITSFTCTAPLVGSLLGFAAQGGEYFYPIVGLLVFSAMLALPFFLLALMPSKLASLPRSGDWMNAVRVVGGLLEIGAAFKFLNTAEVSFRGGHAADAILDTQVVLSIWVVLSLVCGLYLLGLFRTSHDYDEVKVGPGRLLTGSLFLILALYLTPALFGNPPQSPLYEKVVGLFPPDAGMELDTREQIAKRIGDELERTWIARGGPAAPTPGSAPTVAEGAAAPQPERAVKATSNDPAVAVKQERELLAGLSWGLSFEQALEEARAQNRPVLIDFTGVNCANCRTMEQAVMPRREVVDPMRDFVRVRLYTDFVPIETLDRLQTELLAEDNLALELELTGQGTSPLYVVLNPHDRSILAQKPFDPNPSAFVSFLKQGLEKFEGTSKEVARR